ncbi:MAG: thioredoxin [Lachnospiraceae bacterium]|nr:thioredoxin [Lachnospiraceae bacterium]
MECKFTTANFEEEVLNSDKPVLVDFYADWCGPCKMMAPIVENLAEKYDGKCKIGKCNTDEENGLAARYRIMSIPTMIIFSGGKIVETIVGAVPQKELEDKIEKALA